MERGWDRDSELRVAKTEAAGYGNSNHVFFSLTFYYRLWCSDFT